MQKEYFWVPAVAVLFLLFAGGVYSQLSGPGQSVGQENIVHGITFLQEQPVLDSEILLLYFLGQNHPEIGVSSIIDSRVSSLDDFHYPIKQFITGEPISPESVLPKTLDSLYYPDFIHYFNCEPLSVEWINSLRNLTDDGSEFGGYHDSHALIVLQLLKRDYFGSRCGDHPDFATLLDSAIADKASQVSAKLVERDNFDMWVERVGALAFAGKSVSPEDVQFILDQQSPDGGWRGALYYELDDTNPHTTALAVWALAEASS